MGLTSLAKEATAGLGLSLQQVWLKSIQKSKMLGTWPFIKLSQLMLTWQWFSARLQYLQCISNGGTTALHWAIDKVHYKICLNRRKNRHWYIWTDWFGYTPTTTLRLKGIIIIIYIYIYRYCSCMLQQIPLSWIWIQSKKKNLTWVKIRG